MTDEERQAERETTVTRHVQELRAMFLSGEVTAEEHDMIGHIVRVHIGHLIDLSPQGWAMFMRIINESREVQYHE